TRSDRDWSSDVCSSDLLDAKLVVLRHLAASRGAPFRGPRWGCAPRAGSVRCLGRSGTEPSRTLTPTSGPHIPILGGAYLLPRAGDRKSTRLNSSHDQIS